jgi:RNA polymerase sigma factor (sigma-70 family)
MDDPYITRKTLLIRASNPSDEDAWNDFVAYYEIFIQMVLNRLLFDMTDSDDLRQDILLKLWAKLKSYDQQKSKFRTWLSTVIRNTVLDYLAKNGKKKQLLVPEGQILLAADAKNELEQHIQTEWEAYASTMALEKIKPLFSDKAIQIFDMSLDNISVEEISKELEISADSVYKMKTRFINRLHKEIQLIRSETEF